MVVIQRRYHMWKWRKWVQKNYHAFLLLVKFRKQKQILNGFNWYNYVIFIIQINRRKAFPMVRICLGPTIYLRQWRHHIIKTLTELLALCEGNPMVTGVSIRKGQQCCAVMSFVLLAWTSCWNNSRFAGIIIRSICRQTSHIRHRESQNLNVSRLVLQLSLPNQLKSKLKM